MRLSGGKYGSMTNRNVSVAKLDQCPLHHNKNIFPTGRKGVIKSLKAVDAHLVYDELLTNAQQAYGDYLEEHAKVDKLWGVFKAINNFAPQK